MSAMFEFAGGALSVVPNGDDTEVSFELFNVGDESGVAEVGVEVDGNYLLTWNSGELYPGYGDTPRISLGYVEAGNHEALVYVNPGSGQNDHLRQDFAVPPLRNF
ncbi:MAG TPA: hypothetical protein VGR06_20585 [Actinophytocola sp.]|uniref:hypothetical protein n=1 Tax=Actinophytocola sp. TaxID=1872138 RepID=UPI002DF76174|nr:hypothetical protein [Actinophytocola sp.]